MEIIQGEIKYDSEKHTYWHIPTCQYLTSVSEVIRTVYGIKSWEIKPTDTVDDIILKMERVNNARQRGIKVDGYMSEYVKTGTVYIQDEPEDIEERCLIAHRIWEEEFGRLPAESQKIVAEPIIGIAGTMDYWIDGRIVADLKCTYNTEKAWVLQVGAYCWYAPSKVERAGVIHVSPKLYKEGGKWFEYDVDKCREAWHKATDWYLYTKKMNAKKHD